MLLPPASRRSKGLGVGAAARQGEQSFKRTPTRIETVSDDRGGRARRKRPDAGIEANAPPDGEAASCRQAAAGGWSALLQRHRAARNTSKRPLFSGRLQLRELRPSAGARAHQAIMSPSSVNSITTSSSSSPRARSSSKISSTSLFCSSSRPVPFRKSPARSPKSA